MPITTAFSLHHNPLVGKRGTNTPMPKDGLEGMEYYVVFAVKDESLEIIYKRWITEITYNCIETISILSIVL